MTNKATFTLVRQRRRYKVSLSIQNDRSVHIDTAIRQKHVRQTFNRTQSERLIAVAEWYFAYKSAEPAGDPFIAVYGNHIVVK